MSFKTLTINQENNKVGIKEEHFYGDEFLKFQIQKKNLNTYLSEQLFKWAEIFREFQRIAHYEKKGLKIYNKSSNSLIDSLKR